MPDIVIRPFKPADQAAVKSLILTGLAGHWGTIDPTLNPDLDDISRSYANTTFLVAWLNDRIVGTGAIIPKSEEVAEVVRMSVATGVRRQGIGTLILEQLCAQARHSGFHRLVLETTATWSEVITFYRRFGFRITHYQDDDFEGEVHFVLDL